jgi:opacity protein-like surface antigen
MRKLSFILVAVALMMFMASSAFAQDDKPYYFGIKAGLNMSKFSGDDAEEPSYAMGMAGGVFMGYNLSEMFTLMPEVMFMWKGSKETDEEDIDFTWKLYYVDINVLAKVTVPTEGSIKPHFLAGPYLGIKASHGWSSDPEVDDEDAEMIDANLDDYLKGTDFGLVFGAGVDYVLDNGHMVSIEGRYGLGLVIFDDMEEEEVDVKNSSITFLLGYSF